MWRRTTASLDELLHQLRLVLEEADARARVALELEFGQHPMIDFFCTSPVQHAREAWRRARHRG